MAHTHTHTAAANQEFSDSVVVSTVCMLKKGNILSAAGGGGLDK